MTGLFNDWSTAIIVEVVSNCWVSWNGIFCSSLIFWNDTSKLSESFLICDITIIFDDTASAARFMEFCFKHFYVYLPTFYLFCTEMERLTEKDEDYQKNVKCNSFPLIKVDWLLMNERSIVNGLMNDKTN